MRKVGYSVLGEITGVLFLIFAHEHLNLLKRSMNKRERGTMQNRLLMTRIIWAFILVDSRSDCSCGCVMKEFKMLQAQLLALLIDGASETKNTL
jgi:hypothetical protein